MEQVSGKSCFYGKNVLITGGCGFIGSRLVKRMLHEGATIFILTYPNTNPWRLKDVEDNICIYETDIRDTSEINNCIKLIKPEYIFHLAAYGVDSVQNELLTAVHTNITGTVNILNAIKNMGCEKFINIGSSAEYGDKKDTMTEDMCPTPVSIYGSTKACSTIIAHQIAREIGIGIVTLRPFGIFGEGEERHKIFCNTILTILENKDVDLTTGIQYRDYCYVENIVDGIILAASNKSITNEIFNIGSGELFPLKYYIDMIFKNIQTERKPNYGAIKHRSNEMWSPKPDISKIQSMLSWTPRISLEDGIIKTIKWYTENFELYFKTFN